MKFSKMIRIMLGGKSEIKRGIDAAFGVIMPTPGTEGWELDRAMESVLLESFLAKKSEQEGNEKLELEDLLQNKLKEVSEIVDKKGKDLVFNEDVSYLIALDRMYIIASIIQPKNEDDIKKKLEELHIGRAKIFHELRKQIRNNYGY